LGDIEIFALRQNRLSSEPAALRQPMAHELKRLTVRSILNATWNSKNMFHLIWYILIGLISGVIAKSVMHVHITIFWTIVLGIIGSIIGGCVTHMLSRPANNRYHPAGLIFSTLGAILVLFICYKLKIHFPQVELIER
jgi:uncharacterized membrane protein YeaQ/YmgE (transglycosylase-associated protein family)